MVAGAGAESRYQEMLNTTSIVPRLITLVCLLKHATHVGMMESFYITITVRTHKVGCPQRLQPHICHSLIMCHQQVMVFSAISHQEEVARYTPTLVPFLGHTVNPILSTQGPGSRLSTRSNSWTRRVVTYAASVRAYCSAHAQTSAASLEKKGGPRAATKGRWLREEEEQEERENRKKKRKTHVRHKSAAPR